MNATAAEEEEEEEEPSGKWEISWWAMAGEVSRSTDPMELRLLTEELGAKDAAEASPEQPRIRE